jgi:hypothetical protein
MDHLGIVHAILRRSRIYTLRRVSLECARTRSHDSDQHGTSAFPAADLHSRRTPGVIPCSGPFFSPFIIKGKVAEAHVLGSMKYLTEFEMRAIGALPDRHERSSGGGGRCAYRLPLTAHRKAWPRVYRMYQCISNGLLEFGYLVGPPLMQCADVRRL